MPERRKTRQRLRIGRCLQRQRNVLGRKTQHDGLLDSDRLQRDRRVHDRYQHRNGVLGERIKRALRADQQVQRRSAQYDHLHDQRAVQHVGLLHH